VQDLTSFRTQFTNSGAIVELAFLEFTTGTPHPLSSKHNVRLPVNTILDVAYAAVDILGDYVVTTVMSGRDVCCLYLVSWKSGAVTLVSILSLCSSPGSPIFKASRDRIVT
jgi:hypothetical protein